MLADVVTHLINVVLTVVLVFVYTLFVIGSQRAADEALINRLAAFVENLDVLFLRDWILSFGAFVPLAYFLVMVAQVIVSPIPAGPVTFAGTLIFGVWSKLS